MYQGFAKVYDKLMKEDIDYDQWAEYIQEIFMKKGINPKNVVDLACGTGNITLPLAKKGYSMVGIDISHDMLSIADQKSNELHLKIQWLCQDIKNLQVARKMDAFICVCDGVNYILQSKELEDIFSTVYRSLKKDSIFTFDMNSKYKIENILAENTFAYSGEDVSYIWENYYDREEEVIDYELSFFVKDQENYKRFNEIHRQKAYSMKEIIHLLYKAGFKDVKAYNAFSFEKPKPQSERIQYICVK